MTSQTQKPITYADADQKIRDRIASEWDEGAARHMHFDDGFSIVALSDDEPIGLISIAWRDLPPPLPKTVEGYIDIIAVTEPYRRQGIARTLVKMAIERSQFHGAYQVRGWSSEDKIEAIPMWKALGFGMCPAKVFPRGQEAKGYYITKICASNL